jgi:hypothetical protein
MTIDPSTRAARTNDFGDHRFFQWHSIWYQA